ncbi:MAG: hypothetical protein JXA38_07450 [Methanosarcinaceae archaeon]|nr:hypothetical protein [Methanosarcinaceae archaeon]
MRYYISKYLPVVKYKSQIKLDAVGSLKGHLSHNSDIYVLNNESYIKMSGKYGDS